MAWDWEYRNLIPYSYMLELAFSLGMHLKLNIWEKDLIFLTVPSSIRCCHYIRDNWKYGKNVVIYVTWIRIEQETTHTNTTATVQYWAIGDESSLFLGLLACSDSQYHDLWVTLHIILTINWYTMFKYNTIIEIGMYRIFYKFLEILVGTRPRPRPRQFRSDPAPAPAPAKYWTRSVHT